MKIVVFELTGWAHGLLMHNPASMQLPNSGLSVAKKALSPQEEADNAAYLDDKGFLRFPAASIRSCLIKGSTGRKLGKRGAPAVIKGTFFPVEDWFPILDAKSRKPTKKYEIFTARVVNQTTKGAIMCSRARVRDWMARVPVEIDEQVLGDDLTNLLELLNHSGKTVGIGAFKPMCPVGVGGPFGRFSVKVAA